MNIAILNLSGSYKPLDHLGTAADIIQQWLSPHLPDANFSQLDIAAGQALPATGEYDGYVISGSEKGVYDNSDWMQPLVMFLQTLRERRMPVFGICFGHQIMAQAYGGKAEKAEHGFVVGAREYSENGVRYAAYAMHKDQVVQVPDCASVTISAPYCPIAGLEYNFPARSVQFHPEFKSALVAEAIDAFEGDLLTTDQAQASRQSCATCAVADALYAKEAATFFTDAISAIAAAAENRHL